MTGTSTRRRSATSLRRVKISSDGYSSRIKSTYINVSEIFAIVLLITLSALLSRVFLLFCRKRMTAHECLLHPWLTGDHSKWTSPIASSRYLSIRDRLRAKYENWDKYVLPIGRLAEYSSLRKLLIDKYRIYDSCFGEQSMYNHNR